MFSALFRRLPAPSRPRAPHRTRPSLEQLEGRAVPTINQFFPGGTVQGVTLVGQLTESADQTHISATFQDVDPSATQSHVVSLLSFRKLDNSLPPNINPTQQVLIDQQQATLTHYGQTVTLTVALPECDYQADAEVGTLVPVAGEPLGFGNPVIGAALGETPCPSEGPGA
jgi:hypothetical protein